MNNGLRVTRHEFFFFFFKDMSSDLHIVTKELSKNGQVPLQFVSILAYLKLGV